MKTIALWYLVGFLNGDGNVTWSPPMPTREECKRVREVVIQQHSSSAKREVNMTCAQIITVMGDK